MRSVIKVLANELRNIADKLEDGTCVISMDTAEDIINMIAHIPLSKTEAYEYLNVSRSTFDNMVALGELPKGRKVKGKKELIWYKDELEECIKRLKH
jgi:predicted DNA-binding transcriptional regulator AlpA